MHILRHVLQILHMRKSSLHGFFILEDESGKGRWLPVCVPRCQPSKIEIFGNFNSKPIRAIRKLRKLRVFDYIYLCFYGTRSDILSMQLKPSFHMSIRYARLAAVTCSHKYK